MGFPTFQAREALGLACLAYNTAGFMADNHSDSRCLNKTATTFDLAWDGFRDANEKVSVKHNQHHQNWEALLLHTLGLSAQSRDSQQTWQWSAVCIGEWLLKPLVVACDILEAEPACISNDQT